MAFIYVQNPTGGVFAGDRLELRVVAEERARVHVTTTSATKLYRMEGGEAAQRVSLLLGAGAYLEYVPEPIIPQAGSRFEQELTAELAEGATLVAVETIAPGRLARGEAFEYERLLLRTSVRDARGELCADTLLLAPGRWPPSRRGVLGPFAYLGTLLAIAPHQDVATLAERLDERVRELPGALAGAGLLPAQAGVLVRVLAHSSGAVADALHGAWRVARESLLGSPPPRRRK